MSETRFEESRISVLLLDIRGLIIRFDYTRLRWGVPSFKLWTFSSWVFSSSESPHTDGYECFSAAILLRFAAGFFVLVGVPGGGRFTFWHRTYIMHTWVNLHILWGMHILTVISQSLIHGLLTYASNMVDNTRTIYFLSESSNCFESRCFWGSGKRIWENTHQLL